ncbi:fructose-specific PTS transporter subunit EIIC [Lactococcus formosensis subsp. bovis]|uniref:fructose-specific PTS transporter subunit EIIC n=1 Tax=Lactococcus formosensis TaxID=1281486 RepID=UPI001BCDF255|nr:fructose-specific PTS transporter subunit EIIC [Lactococcus formosensis]
MNLSQATSKDLIFLNQSFTSKSEIFEFVAETFEKQGVVSSSETFKAALYERENHGVTGFENGLAIPHGKSSSVQKARFVLIRLAEPLSSEAYPSLDPSNQVDTVFVLAIPKSEAGSTHLTLLADLAGKLGNADYLAKIKAATSETEILRLLDHEEKTATNVSSENNGLILGITACAAGIAHTYMAAEAISKKAAELGYRAKIEKQGANGIEDRITAADVNQAVGVIFAHDIALKDMQRFANLPKVDVPVAEPIKNAGPVVDELLEKAKNFVADENVAVFEEAEEKTSFLKTLSASTMTGISYMIPLLVAAGLMIGISTLIWTYALGLPAADIASPDYHTATGLTLYTHYLNLFGSMLLKFIYPIFGMFAAYAIADRTGLIAGFAGGLFAGGLHYTFFNITDGGIPSGFLGALVLGLLAGFIVKFLNTKIKVSKNLQAIKPMFLVSGISVLAIFILNYLIVQPVFGGLNNLMTEWITAMSGSGQLVLASIIAAATAFDLGGPLNKAAGAIAIGLAAEEIFPLTARVLAIVIPPVGLGLSTIIDRFVVKCRVYPEDLRVAGGTSFLLGFIAISEGGIPFMLRNPLITIPINLIGAVAGSVIATAMGAIQWLPLPAVWGWPLVTNLPAYLIGLTVGVLIIAFLNIFVRYALIKRKEARGEAIGFDTSLNKK